MLVLFAETGKEENVRELSCGVGEEVLYMRENFVMTKSSG